MAIVTTNNQNYSDIADAIREKNGTSATYTPAQMAAAIEAISGGGGSLPSVISKIDGGSFTLASDTVGTSHWISHNLGELPKGIKVWTDDDDLRTSTSAVAQRYIICSVHALLNWTNGTTSMLLLPNHLYRNTNGATSNTGSPASQASTGVNIQTTRFNVSAGSLYYKAGVEYKWIAWA